VCAAMADDDVVGDGEWQKYRTHDNLRALTDAVDWDDVNREVCPVELTPLVGNSLRR
jgi:hypothetical protein